MSNDPSNNHPDRPDRPDEHGDNGPGGPIDNPERASDSGQGDDDPGSPSPPLSGGDGGNDGPRRGGSGNDGPGRDGPGRDGPGSNGPGSNGPGRDGPRRDGPRRDGPRRDGPRRDGPRRDGPRRDGPGGGPNRGGPRRDGGPNRDGGGFRGGPNRNGPRDQPAHRVDQRADRHRSTERTKLVQFAPDDNIEAIATVVRGCEPVLLAELASIGISAKAIPGGVRMQTTLLNAMRICLYSRVAQRVQVEIGKDIVTNERQLYAAARGLRLERFADPDTTFSVRAHVSGRYFRDQRYVGLLVKDAIVDGMRDAYGRRADVGRRTPDVSYSVTIRDNELTIGLELHGKPLHMRRYRKHASEAAVKETLGAAMVLYSGWTGRGALLDPTCGGGTIPIEAGLISANRVPARDHDFGFLTWPTMSDVLPEWDKVLASVDEISGKVRGAILGRDSEVASVQASRINARAAGLDGEIAFEVGDALKKLEPLAGNRRYIVCNPPYGERLEPEGGVDVFIQKFEEKLRALDGHTVVLLLADTALEFMDTSDAHGMLPVRNGKIPCHIVRWIF